MNNKELQDILKTLPDDLVIEVYYDSGIRGGFDRVLYLNDDTDPVFKKAEDKIILDTEYGHCWGGSPNLNKDGCTVYKEFIS